MKKGIDVSEHNGNINFAAVKAAGIEFAMIRAALKKFSATVMRRSKGEQK